MNLDAKIEAILFFKTEPVEIKTLGSLLGVGEEEVKEAIDELDRKLSERGVKLLRNNDAVMLGTAPEMSETIESLVKEELQRDLGKAGLETLSIVLYRGPVTRSDVDYIRGVNSAYILRHLLIRGLIEKKQNPRDQRSYLYSPTFDLLSHLGISKVEDLTEYHQFREEVKAFEEQE